MFWLRYYKMVQSLYKKPTLGVKNHMRNLDNYRQAVESPKGWNLMGYFCPKNTSLQLKHIQSGFIQHYFQLFAWKFTKWLMPFLKSYAFFITQPLYMSKWKFSDLPLLALKFSKFLMTFLEPRASFSSNFASLFSVARLTLLYFLI